MNVNGTVMKNFRISSINLLEGGKARPLLPLARCAGRASPLLSIDLYFYFFNKSKSRLNIHQRTIDKSCCPPNPCIAYDFVKATHGSRGQQD